MKKIAPIIILVVILMGGVYFLGQRKTGNNQITPIKEQTQEQKKQEEGKLKSSLKGLLGLGKDLKCTWNYQDEEVATSGTVYVSGQKTKSESSIKSDEVDMTTHFLSDGQKAYTWNEGQNQGYVFDLSDFEDTNPEENEQMNESESQEMRTWDTEYEYDCSPWTADNSVFQIPQNISFTDMNQQLEQMQQGVENICNSLPEPQKTECLQSLEK